VNLDGSRGEPAFKRVGLERERLATSSRYASAARDELIGSGVTGGTFKQLTGMLRTRPWSN
jgi:hypothetical protein